MAAESGWDGPTSLPSSVPRSLGATTARQYGRSRIGGAQSARLPKRCASAHPVQSVHPPAASAGSSPNQSSPPHLCAGMLTADCQCAACLGAFSPRGWASGVDKVVAAGSRHRSRKEKELTGSRTPRLPSLGSRGSSDHRHPALAAAEPQRTARRSMRHSARESTLQLELDADVVDTGRSPQPLRPPVNGDGSVKKQDLSSKLQDLYEDSHASYSPRTMAIYSDRQQALRADPSGVAKDEANLVANLARGRRAGATVEMVMMPGQHGVMLSQTAVKGSSASDERHGLSPRRAGTQANMLAMAEGYSAVSL
jgi:hypothetical protein